MAPVTAVVIGAGSRGSSYSAYARDFPADFKIVGIVEPRAFYRKQMQDKFGIQDKNAFQTWEELDKLERMADCALVTTPDRYHKDPAIAMANKGYHVLLEKPMAPSFKDCQEIVAACEKNKVILAVCHVLRYSPQARKIKTLLESGVIGDIMNIQLLEPVGFWHFAHSFVRGNWKKTEDSSFCLLAKSCHDIDLISYWMGNVKCQAVSSFGSLKHFKPSNKPEGAGSRCTDCSVENDCPYSAKKIYLDLVKQGHTGWPVSVITEVPDIESVTNALNTGPYGKCVYESENDVVDNQVVNMQFEGGATVSFSMVACTQKICERQVRIFGSKGQIECDFGTSQIKLFDFLKRRTTAIDLFEELSDKRAARMGGHGGADYFAMDSFVKAVAEKNPNKVLTGPKETLESHRLTFAAEKARLENKVINLTEDLQL